MLYSVKCLPQTNWTWVRWVRDICSLAKAPTAFPSLPFGPALRAGIVLRSRLGSLHMSWPLMIHHSQVAGNSSRVWEGQSDISGFACNRRIFCQALVLTLVPIYKFSCSNLGEKRCLLTFQGHLQLLEVVTKVQGGFLFLNEMFL